MNTGYYHKNIYEKHLVLGEMYVDGIFLRAVVTVLVDYNESCTDRCNFYSQV